MGRPVSCRWTRRARASKAALGADLRALLGALSQVEKATLAGYDWDGRGGLRGLGALAFERVQGLVSVQAYNLQDIARSAEPAGRPRRNTAFGTSTISTANAAGRA